MMDYIEEWEAARDKYKNEMQVEEQREENEDTPDNKPDKGVEESAEEKADRIRAIIHSAAVLDDIEYMAARTDIAKYHDVSMVWLDGQRKKLMKEIEDKVTTRVEHELYKESTLPAWIRGLQVSNNGWIFGNMATVSAFFENDERLVGLLATNQLSGDVCVMRKPPWRTADNETFPRSITEDDYNGIAIWMATPEICGYTVREPSVRAIVSPAASTVANSKQWNPVKEWLNSLEWDGTPRVDSFLTDIIGAPQTDYYMGVSRVLLIAPCKRIETPGCKMDYMPIIYSQKQGYFKSTMVAKLYGEGWTRTLSPRAITKGNDFKREMQGAWAIEIPELVAMHQAQVEAVKSLVSETSDSWVPKYVEGVKTRPRVPILIGTTNDPSPLKDSSGNRRFLMVECKNKIDIDYILSMRDQLFAEAWRRKDEDILLRGEANNIAETLQLAACEVDGWENDIVEYLRLRTEVEGPLEIYTHQECLGGYKDQYSHPKHGSRICSILRKLGWKRCGGGNQGRHYWRKIKE